MKPLLRNFYSFLIIMFLVMVACSTSNSTGTKAVPATLTIRSTSVASTAAVVPTNTPESSVVSFTPNSWAGPVPKGAIARIGKGTIKQITSSPDGKSLIVATDVEIDSYDEQTFSLNWSYSSPDYMGAVAFSPKGDFLAVGFGQGEIDLIKPSDGSLI